MLPLWVGKVCLATKELCVFRAQLRLCAFLITEGATSLDTSNCEAMSLVYDVALDLARELETGLLSGDFDEALLPVLSGCYSTVDYFSNRLASLDADDECIVDRDSLSLGDYMKAASVMQQCINHLRGDLWDEQCSSQIDYRKIHAIVGLRAVADFILNAVEG